MKTHKKVWAVLLSCLLTLTMCTAFGGVVFAEDPPEPAVIGSGECGADGGNLTWTLTDDGVLRISGEGAMRDYAIGQQQVGTDEHGDPVYESLEAPWSNVVANTILTPVLLERLGYGSIEEAEAAIKNGELDQVTVQTLSMELYAQYKGLYEETVIVEEGVTSIGAYAFYDWNAETLTLPASLESIGDYAFYRGNYASVVIPAGVASIGDYAFNGLPITEIVVPASVTMLSDRAFVGCYALESITVLNDSLDLHGLFVTKYDADGPLTFDDFAAYNVWKCFKQDYEMLYEFGLYLANTEMYVLNLVFEGMPEEQAVAAANAIYQANAVQYASMTMDLQGKTIPEIMDELVERINNLFAINFTKEEMLTFKNYFTVSPALIAAVRAYNETKPEGTANYSFYNVYRNFVQECIYDRDAYIADKLDDGYTPEEAANAFDRRVRTEINEIVDECHLDFTATDAAEFQTKLLAKINADLNTSFTVETSGNLTPTPSGLTNAMKEILSSYFDVPFSEVWDVQVYDYELYSRGGYSTSYRMVPWLLLKVNCTNDYLEELEAADLNLVIMHQPAGEATGRDEPTCTEAGAIYYPGCTACDAGAYVEAIPALGHAWDEGEVTTDPTCTERGVKTFACTRENCEETKTEFIRPLGHDIEEHDAQAPTCVAVGWDAYETCTRCDYTTYSEIPATGEHVWGEWEVITPATATEDGEKTRTCIYCDETDTEAIPATGEEEPAEEDVCVCGKVHKGFFGKFIKFFHKIIYFFKNLFK